VILINRDTRDPHLNLFEAAADAGIAHVIPSAFGYEVGDNTYLRALPPFHVKAAVEDRLSELTAEGRLVFTAIHTSIFLDWALERGIIANLATPGGSTMLIDGGDVKVSGTLLADIGKAITNVLLEPEKFAGRQVHIHTAVITQNKLLSYARELAPEREFPTTNADSEAIEKVAWARWNAGEQGPDTMRMFLLRPPFGHSLGLFDDVQNAELDLTVWGEHEIRALVRRYVKGAEQESSTTRA